MKIDDLFANLEVKANSSDLSDDNQIEILSSLERLVFFVLQ